MVSATCRCGYDNTSGLRNCPKCSRLLELAVMPDLTHIQNWNEIENQFEEMRMRLNDQFEGTDGLDDVLGLLDFILADAAKSLSGCEAIPHTESYP